MSVPSPPIPLQYFPPAPSWRKRYYRPFLIIFAVVGVTFAWRRWEPSVYRQICQLYWQHQCLTYNPPPGFITYDEDGTGTSNILHAGRGYLPFVYDSMWRSHFAAIAPMPRCLANFLTLNPPSPYWGAGDSPAILFAHQIRATSGARYLIIVRRDQDDPDPSLDWYPFEFGFIVSCQVFRPATLASPPLDIAHNTDVDWSRFEPEDDDHPIRLRFYGGQIDPRDPSRFTIPYDYNGKRDYLDGYLDDQAKEPYWYSGNCCLHLASRYASPVVQPRYRWAPITD